MIDKRPPAARACLTDIRGPGPVMARLRGDSRAAAAPRIGETA